MHSLLISSVSYRYNRQLIGQKTPGSLISLSRFQTSFHHAPFWREGGVACSISPLCSENSLSVSTCYRSCLEALAISGNVRWFQLTKSLWVSPCGHWHSRNGVIICSSEDQGRLCGWQGAFLLRQSRTFKGGEEGPFRPMERQEQRSGGQKSRPRGQAGCAELQKWWWIEGMWKGSTC